MLVSVVIPTRDRSALLREALASVAAVRGPDLEFDIIVADNGASDQTRAIAAEFGARYVHTATPGAAAARNAGLRLVRGEFIAFLDDDDVWLPGHLRPHLRLLTERPEFRAAVGQVVNTNLSLTDFAEPWPASLPSDGHLFAAMLEFWPQIGATVVRASVLESVGYFDERLMSEEDLDWHLRIARRHLVGFVAQPCVLFRQRPPLDDERLLWKRLPYDRKVLLRHTLRAARPKPPPALVCRVFLRHAGMFYASFVECARQHDARGERQAALASLLRAIASSPVHAGKDLLHVTAQRALFTQAFKHAGPRARAASPD
ncbi:MAG TPA: glycosyltransferase family A protein [Dehalococcoidia bacterium]|nr:glycosyltransferase family A protein [Dehalococcoidia bacterium]